MYKRQEPLTIENLKKAADEIKNKDTKVSAATDKTAYTKSGLDLLTARRQLEETRLKMTSEANLSLLEKGISIDTMAVSYTHLARTVDYAKGPSGFIRPDGVEVKEMDEALMEETLQWYAETAASARKIGFDSIFLHFGHGWLPAQFLSPHYNHRTDSYGGSIENRSRFPLRILETVRKAVGKDYPIDMRVSAYEWIEDSISFEDVMYFLKQAEQYVDTVQISSGIDKVLSLIHI